MPEGLWRHRDFLKFWAAQTVSQVGSQVTLLALPLAAILVLHASALEVALLAAFDTLPFLLFALPAGVWVDRLRRRPLMILADAGRAASLASIPAAYAAGELVLPHLYAVGFVNGVLTVFFDVSYLAYLPSLVERRRLAEGNAKLEVTRSAAQTAGPGIGGGLVGAVGAPAAIAADAVSFGISGALIALIRRHEEPPERSTREPLRVELWQGLRYVFGQPYLRALTLTTSTWNLFASAIFALFVVYAVRRLGLSAELVGIVFMVSNVGAMLGAALAARVVRLAGLGPTIVWSAIVSSVAFIAIPGVPRELAVPILVASGIVETFAGTLYNVNQLTLRQAITPQRLQGRMNAVVRFMYWGTQPVGAALGGVLASQIGLRTTLWVGAIGAIAAMLPLAASSIRRLERIPESVEPAPAHA